MGRYSGAEQRWVYVFLDVCVQVAVAEVSRRGAKWRHVGCEKAGNLDSWESLPRAFCTLSRVAALVTAISAR